MNNLFSNITRPIMQAPIGSACSVELALAVTNAGGIGTLAFTWDSPESVTKTVAFMNRNTDGLYAANYVLAFEPRSLKAALDAGIPAIMFSWGMSPEPIELVRRSDALLGIQVGSKAAAETAINLGADFLICQGNEAGGHVQSSTNLEALLKEVVALAEIPVIAAGGIANADDVAGVLEAGASIASLGTRFVNASESLAHSSYQQAIIGATVDDVAYTCCFDGGWPHSNSRVLRNNTLNQWEAAGCPQPGQRPEENAIVATTAAGWEIPRYHIASPVNTTTGEVLDLALYAGTSVARIHDVLPAADIVEQLCTKLHDNNQQMRISV